MSWKGVTVHEQRQSFIRDYRLSIYSVTELAQRCSISRKTAYKWIHRWQCHGEDGLREEFRTPHSCLWAAGDTVRDEVIRLRAAHFRWGPRKLLALVERAFRPESAGGLSCCTDTLDSGIGEADEWRVVDGR